MVPRLLVVVLLPIFVISACTSSGDTEEEPSTSTSAVTTLPETTTSQQTTTTSTTLAPIGEVAPPSYQIVNRVATDEGGDEVVVLLDPTSYDSLSDIDLFDIIAEVVELFPPVRFMHVVDDPAAARVVVDPDASQEARVVLDDHYLARLDEGFRITYLGPFASSGTAVLGS